jgi:hypothetical protein
MHLTQRERDETNAVCREKALQCRELAARISLADQRVSMEQTAKMWDDLAAALCGPAALHEVLEKSLRAVADPASIAPDGVSADTDESDTETRASKYTTT